MTNQKKIKKNVKKKQISPLAIHLHFFFFSTSIFDDYQQLSQELKYTAIYTIEVHITTARKRT